MMYFFSISFGLCLALLTATISFADETEVEEQPSSSEYFVPIGFYLGAGGLAVFDEFDSNIPFASLPVDKVDEAFGFSIWAGRRLQPHLAVEAQFESIKGLDVRLDGGHTGRPHTDLDFWILSANTKVFLPWGRLQPFAKFGLGAIKMKLDINDSEDRSGNSSKSDFMVRFGGGLDIFATRSISIVFAADYVMPVDALEKLPFLAVNMGLQYHF